MYIVYEQFLIHIIWYVKQHRMEAAGGDIFLHANNIQVTNVNQDKITNSLTITYRIL